MLYYYCWCWTSPKILLSLNKFIHEMKMYRNLQLFIQTHEKAEKARISLGKQKFTRKFVLETFQIKNSGSPKNFQKLSIPFFSHFRWLQQPKLHVGSANFSPTINLRHSHVPNQDLCRRQSHGRKRIWRNLKLTSMTTGKTMNMQTSIFWLKERPVCGQSWASRRGKGC